MCSDIADIRREYLHKTLDESDVDSDPFIQFQQWFQEATDFGIDMPNAMALATVSKDARPGVRFVLLKDFNREGFVFYTNSTSAKGRDLANNRNAAVVFYWGPMDRQVRIEGSVTMVSPQEADEYFSSRPLGSRISVWVAPQSTVISGRQFMESKVSELEKEYPDGIVPRPEAWTGYRLCPESIEFWQGRENRLHDRILYTRLNNDDWRIQRLAP